MAYVPVPTRTSTTSSMYADVNQLQDNIDVIYAAQNPIGSQYVQYASVASNDVSVACPASEAPAALFGGTWSKLWPTEAVFFRTEGSHLEVSQDTNRTAGKQTDNFQSHSHYETERSSASGAQTGDGYIHGMYSSSKTSGPVDDGNGTPRTGLETYPVNRIKIIWRRDA